MTNTTTGCISNRHVFSHSSGDCSPRSGCQHVSSCGQESESEGKLSGVSSYEAANPVRPEPQPHDPAYLNHLPKAGLRISSLWGLGLQHRNLVRGRCAPASGPSRCPQREGREKRADGGVLERDLKRKVVPSISGTNWMQVLDGGSFVVSLALIGPSFLFCTRADVAGGGDGGV